MSQITLYNFGEAFGLPDISPFGIKLETYLRLAEIPFEKQRGSPFRSPTGKLPYIRMDGNFLSDSSAIIRTLKSRFGDPLDAQLTPQEQGIAKAYQSLLEEHLYFVYAYHRWIEPQGWANYKHAIGAVLQGAGAPRFLVPLLLPSLRRKMQKTLWLQGVSRHPPEEITKEGYRILDALAAYLGEKTFFFGEQPASFDASLYAFLALILYPPLPSPFQSYLQASHPILIAHCNRIKQRAYP
jgi:glutathione S-transferase